MNVRQWLSILIFAIIVAIFGYWLASTAAPGRRPHQAQLPVSKPRVSRPLEDPAPKWRHAERQPTAAVDAEAAARGALEGQRVLVFKDQESLRRFLERAGNGIRLLGRIDALHALRVGFANYSDLAALLDGAEELSFIFPVTIPPLPEGSVQPGAVPLGDKLLDWLGVSGDNSDWGAGIRIAILDTGVASHSAFESTIRSVNLVDLPADPTALNGHGTAVASVIIGRDPFTPGVAPGAEILSIRVANDMGQSDSFLLAQGIMAAVDGGARLINISMGGFGQSALLENAVAYARERGVLIFAPTGNNGIGQVSYPAAYEGVIAIGAVDALGDYLDFSNSGNEVAASAPGFAINAAYPGDKVASVTGTSFSAPIAVGVTAALMTELNLSGWQAWQRAVTYSNDTGALGKDAQTGAGALNIGRVLQAGTPGIYDAAVASQRILPPDGGNPYGQLEILVENRGTETLINTAVSISVGATRSSNNITALAPNKATIIRVPLPRAADSSSLVVDSRVSLTGGRADARPANDRRLASYAVAGSR